MTKLITRIERRFDLAVNGRGIAAASRAGGDRCGGEDFWRRREKPVENHAPAGPPPRGYSGKPGPLCIRSKTFHLEGYLLMEAPVRFA